MIHSVSVVFVILSIQSIMNAKEFDEKFSTSKPLQWLTGVGLAVFSSFMFVGWQKALSEVKATEEAAAVSATAPAATPTEKPTATASVTETPTATPSVVESAPEPIGYSTTTEETPMVQESGSMTLVSETLESAPSATISKAQVPEKAPMYGAKEITDPDTLQDLNSQLYNQIDRDWQSIPSFSNHLVYRVQVKSDGAISSYDAINPAAKEYVNEIPLSELNNSSADMSQESVGKFLVVFTPNGILEVSPWVGQKFEAN